MQIVSKSGKLRSLPELVWRYIPNWAKLPLAIFIIILTIAFAILSPFGVVVDLWSWFRGADTQTAKLADVINTSGRNLGSQIDEALGLDCNLSDTFWDIRAPIRIEGQRILLEDGTEVGSIRFLRPLYDAFSVNLTFIPESSEMGGIGLTLSIKDDLDNELSVTIGDGDYESYRYVYKERGVEKQKQTAAVARIMKNKNVLLRLETVQHANGLGASAFLVYSPDKKASESVRVDLLRDQEIPFFMNNAIFLNLGLRRADKESSPVVQIAKCKIREKRQE